jgi:hypothetical protein
LTSENRIKAELGDAFADSSTMTILVYLFGIFTGVMLSVVAAHHGS